jgi:hypothetical protein
MKIAKLFLMAAGAVLLLGAFAVADTPGAHPRYLHALSDLRLARAHVARVMAVTPNGRMYAEEGRALDQIDHALTEVTDLAADTGKSLNDQPAVDQRQAPADHMRAALQLLDEAQRDVDEHESDPRLHELKHRAVQYIEEARRAVRHAIESEHY